LKQGTGETEMFGPNMVSVGGVAAKLLEIAQESSPFFSVVHHDSVEFLLGAAGSWAKVEWELVRSCSMGLMGLWRC